MCHGILRPAARISSVETATVVINTKMINGQNSWQTTYCNVTEFRISVAVYHLFPTLPVLFLVVNFNVLFIFSLKVIPCSIWRLPLVERRQACF